MTKRIRIGTSGWNYEHWRGTFYPAKLPSKAWFQHYCGVFDTVEINNTFYRQPDNATFDAWARQAPDGFVYAVKANRYLTHLKRLKEPAEPLQRFLDGARRLDEHLGPILYQLPPRWKKDLARFGEFADALPSELTHVIEFRDLDWLAEDTYELLAEHGIGLCIHDLLPRHPRQITGPVAYLRFHGTTAKYGGRYGVEGLRGWAEWITQAAERCEVFAYFNNDANAYAVSDASCLKELLG
jgi:uncharacterized protein YecE (DUF72 family)